MAGFRRGLAFDESQHRAQCTAKFELQSLPFGIIRQQRQLGHPPLELRRRLCHCRAGGGAMTRLAPEGDGFFNQPRLGIMVRKEFGLSVHQLGGKVFEGCGNPGMELLSRATQ